MQLMLGRRSFDLSKPRVMGVLNITPDSFSDGGDFIRRDRALRQALAMVRDGAEIIDIGGESTRPGAADVSVDEEIGRVLPVLDAIAHETEAVISIDTSKPEVMQAAVAAGASLINDVYALRRDGALEKAASLPAGICLMHMLGEPGTMQRNPQYDQLPGDVVDFLGQRVQACLDAGIARDRLLVDPGFGFGKSDAHNLVLLRELDALQSLGLPVLAGLSRKRTIGNLTGREPKDRVAGSLAAAVLAVARGAHIVRTHDVAATVDALAVATAVLHSPTEAS